MTGVAAVYAAIAAALPDVDGWRQVPDPPSNAGALPVMWLELLAGGGSTSNSLGVPLTLRIIAVPKPQPAPAMYAAITPLIDALDAALRMNNPAGVAVTASVWRLAVARLGSVDHTALNYDLTLTYHPIC